MTRSQVEVKLEEAVQAYATSPVAKDDLTIILKEAHASLSLEHLILRALILGYTQGYAKGAGLILSSEGISDGTSPVHL